MRQPAHPSPQPGPRSTVAEPGELCEAAQGALDCRLFEHLDGETARLWDGFAPNHRPDLHSGFLHAAVAGNVVADPAYLMLFRRDTLCAIAFCYTLLPDLLGVIPVWLRRLLQWTIPAVRRGWRPSLRVCGPPVWNGASGIHMAPGINEMDRKVLLCEIERQLVSSAGEEQFVFFREFRTDEVQSYAGELDGLGYFGAELLPGMALEMQWSNLEQYLHTLRSSYRRHFRRDLRAGEALHWELRESFDDLADVAARLFDNVHLQAEFRFERLTAGFFREVSSFGPSRLLVARDPGSGKVVGVNLLLFADDYVQFVYIGMDYDRIEPYRLYFNLFERSLIAAIEHGAKRCTLGADSYTFKTRLGAEPYVLSGYLWHRRRLVRSLLRTGWRWMFDDIPVMSRRVFNPDGAVRPEGE